MRVLQGTPCGGGNISMHTALATIDVMHQVVNHRNQTVEAVINDMQKQNVAYQQNNPQHVQYVNQQLEKLSYSITLQTLGGESLLQRGRNHLAQVALRGGFDKLLFVDADCLFTWPQYKKLLDSPHPITAGLCPLKVYPIHLNFLPYQEDERFFERAHRSVEGMKKMAEAHGSNYVSVPFVGTAFLCIDTSVFRKLVETCDHYLYPNSQTSEPESHWDFFKVQAVKESYLSEDWGFCHLARQAGYKVMIDTDVITGHVGNHIFKV